MIPAHTQRLLPALAVTALLAGCGAAQPQSKEPDPLPVEVVTARGGEASGSVSAVGRIAHAREMTLAFRVPGTLARLDADIGDQVSRGQALAQLDATDLAARVAQGQGDVERAERALARYATLNETGAVAHARYEDGRTALDQARAALRAAAFNRASATLSAPASGIVLERIAQAGETVSAGQAVLRLADVDSPLLVRIPVPENAIGRVRAGAAARLSVAGRSDVPGVVSRVGASVDPRTGTVQVEVRLGDPSGLVSGMTGTVEIASAAAGAPDITAVPAEAVLEAKNGLAALFLLDVHAQRGRRRIVRFLGFSGEDALVAGLPAGARVITSGAGFAADGQRVRVIGSAR
jgi:RND family efflux transporter MFP subunit